MPLRLMAILAHPDDESMGLGGALARCHDESVHTSVVTATLGQAGRYRGIRPGEPGHPGAEGLGEIRRKELDAAVKVLGVDELIVLDYVDQKLDQADPQEILPRLAAAIRRIRPQVVVTFAPDGAYGHPDHIAISQFAGAAIVSAADPAVTLAGGDAAHAPHAVDKFYYMAWNEVDKDAFEKAFRRMAATVDGIERSPRGWPAWQITTVIDTHAQWDIAWKSVECHESQIAAYEALSKLPPEAHEALWGKQSFYRVFSRVNAGRTLETDLFAGLRDAPADH
jgi:LmbE family N-acetylglucosaminyl deacetylase